MAFVLPLAKSATEKDEQLIPVVSRCRRQHLMLCNCGTDDDRMKPLTQLCNLIGRLKFNFLRRIIPDPAHLSCGWGLGTRLGVG